MFGSTKFRRPRAAGAAASRLTSYWPSTLRARKAISSPSCWLPNDRFRIRARARPGVSAPVVASLMIRSTRPKSCSKVARLRSIHSNRSTTAGVSSARGSSAPIASATIGSIAQQLGTVERLRRRTVGRAQAGALCPKPAARDAPNRLPVDQSRPGAAQQLALHGRGAHRKQSADDDPHPDPACAACHAGSLDGCHHRLLNRGKRRSRRPFRPRP